MLLGITDDTVFSKEEEDMQVLTSLSFCTHYALRGDAVLAEITIQPTQSGSPSTGKREREIERRTVKAHRIRDIDSKIEKVLEQFLRMSPMFFNDSSRHAHRRKNAPKKTAEKRREGKILYLGTFPIF